MKHFGRPTITSLESMKPYLRKNGVDALAQKGLPPIERATQAKIEQLVQPELPKKSVAYLDSLIYTQNICEVMGLDIRAVGGTVADFISPFSPILINPETRQLHVSADPTISALRSDNTQKDADIIVLDGTAQGFADARGYLRKVADAYPQVFPVVSMEEVGHHEKKPKRYKLAQTQENSTQTPPSEKTPSRRQLGLVSTIDYYPVDNSHEGVFLGIGKGYGQEINQQSLEPWTLVVHGKDEGTPREWHIQTLHPIGLYLSYIKRSPIAGPKKKDITPKTYINPTNPTITEVTDKLSVLHRLASTTREIAGAEKTDSQFAEWYQFLNTFIKKIPVKHPIQTAVLYAYWNTPIGEFLAHHLAKAGDIFSGSRRATTSLEGQQKLAQIPLPASIITPENSLTTA